MNSQPFFRCGKRSPVFLTTLLGGLLLLVPRESFAILPGETFHLGFETEDDLLKDVPSRFAEYRSLGREILVKRRLAIVPGKFGNALHIQDGRPISKGAWNQSGLDCDLIVAVLWGEWRTKPHYWGAGAFHGERGTVAFWVKSATLNPGIVFVQGHIGWGRMERDLFAVEVDAEGRLSAFIRDLRYDYHRIRSETPCWETGKWQHIAVAWDQAYGMILYHNGTRIASTWGKDAWWKTGYPGFFSFFLPESYYDEFFAFDRPLTGKQIRTLYEKNSFEETSQASVQDVLDENAVTRLLDTFGPVEDLDLPVVTTGNGGVLLRQILPSECHDEKVPAWWVMDGRYELAWPHPYRLFTFVLGDVDFHGSQVRFDFSSDTPSPHFVMMSGILDRVRLFGVPSEGSGEETLLAELDSGSSFFDSRRIQIEETTSLRIPLVEKYGSPPGLEGSAHLPLSGETRIHEIQFWRAEPADLHREKDSSGVRSYFLDGPKKKRASLPRYGEALRKLIGSRDRTFLLGSRRLGTPTQFSLQPMRKVQLLTSDLEPDCAVDRIELVFLFLPNAPKDILWINLRDPANPSRLWSQVVTRVEHDRADEPREIRLILDIPDLMLASEDRIWLELRSVHGGQIFLGDPERPSKILLHLSPNRQKSLEEYASYEILPCRMQFSKEYNYKPWQRTNEEVTLQRWTRFGGPYDMAYPPLAVLRHDPDNETGGIYRTLVLERRPRAWVGKTEVRRPIRPEVPSNAPPWAVWERELIRINRRVTHWIAEHQRSTGEFWGGWNDDSFIPLGFPVIPLLGDQTVRKAWLRFYDGLETTGIFADGYCDIRPIDPLHITDYIASRGLMLAFGLGDPRVFERELRTCEQYSFRVTETNKRLEGLGEPPLTGTAADRKRKGVTLLEAMEAQILRYSSTHVRWYAGLTGSPEPYRLRDRRELTRRMMEAVSSCDSITEFDFTRSMVHTDGQGVGIGRNELVAALFGGKLQGRFEPHPHSIAVTREGGNIENPAMLVNQAGDESLLVNLYNFSTSATATTLRFWRLRKGIYEVTLKQDADDDGFPDGASSLWSREMELQRFSTMDLQVPPQTNCLLNLRLVEKQEEPEKKPDLALSLEEREKRSLPAVVLHNLGSVPATGIEIEVRTATGETLSKKRVDRIASPFPNYHAARVVLTFETPDRNQPVHLVVDPSDKIEEIYEENNEIVIHPSGGR